MNLEDFIKIVHDFIGDDTSERALKFVDDITDAFTTVANNTTDDGEDWHAKYDELNESWRKKYMHRFFNGEVIGDNTQSADDDDIDVHVTPETVTTDDLFDKED